MSQPNCKDVPRSGHVCRNLVRRKGCIILHNTQCSKNLQRILFVAEMNQRFDSLVLSLSEALPTGLWS